MNEQSIFQKCIFEKNVQYWNFHNFLMKTTHLKYLGKKSGKNDDSLELLIIWPIFSLYFCTSVQLRTFILPVPFLSSCIKSYCLLMSKIQRKGKSFRCMDQFQHIPIWTYTRLQLRATMHQISAPSSTHMFYQFDYSSAAS